jgi:hypothetical protein
MPTTIVAALLFIALCVLASGTGAAAASLPAAPVPNTGANTGNLDMTSPGGFFAPPPPAGLSTGPGGRATPPAASGPAPASPFPPPYRVQSPTVPKTSPLGPSPGGTPNTPGPGGGTGTALPPAP